jgi:dipeptidyl aminopeptidase/acylaminoacyl peptidase
MIMNTPETAPQKSGIPSLRDMLLLETPVDVRISRDSTQVAFILNSTNWKDNRFESVCYVHNLASGATYPLNRSGSVQQVEWVENESLALLKSGPGEEEKQQIFLYEGLVGEGWAVTEHKTGVEWFKPFAQGFLFLAKNPEREEKKARTEKYGTYEAFEHEDSASALYYVGLKEARQFQEKRRTLLEDEAKELIAPIIEISCLLDAPLSIQSVATSPTGNELYINCTKRDDLVYSLDTSSYRIHLDAQAALAEHIRREKASKEKKVNEAETSSAAPKKEEKKDYSYLGEIQRLALPIGATINEVSPDGSKLLLAYQGRDRLMFTREDLWAINRGAVLQASDSAEILAGMVNLTSSLDRDLLNRFWVDAGIYASFPDGCKIQIARIEENGQITPLDLQGKYLSSRFHVSPAGVIVFVGANSTTFPEVFLARPDTYSKYNLTRLTVLDRAIEGWDVGTIEAVRWKSKDGTEIEGVLRKPANFDPTKKYPLVLVVHGGPLWFSPAYLLSIEDRCYYPAVQFIQKDILVLKPNYRGSTGRGQAFAELNVNNLGIGDLWDIESAVDSLVEQGWVDADRVGCMGWSQGGYISAFVGLHSQKFKAVSVGAGISDWYTYHISNDIPDFTIDYLSSSPFKNRDLYQKTSPISNLSNANTPMLIQHGQEDKRVPFSNAMELYRGLQAMGVPVKLFAFPGMGHGISKPRECHAVMFQNLAWFSHYLLGEEKLR